MGGLHAGLPPAVLNATGTPLTARIGLANGLCCARDPCAKPATDSISFERNFTEVCLFARPCAELAAPPTMRHHAATSATTIADLMLADLRLSHHTLVQLSMSSCSDLVIRCGEAAVLLFAAIDLLSEPVCPPRAACGSFPGQPSARPPVMELLPVLRASQEER